MYSTTEYQYRNMALLHLCWGVQPYYTTDLLLDSPAGLDHNILMLKPLKLQRIANVDVLYQETYPNNYDAVLRGAAYWYPHPINILGYYGKFTVLGGYMEDIRQWWVDRDIDMDHPKCYYCGKFVKKGDWWKGKFTGPCLGCDDMLYFHNQY